MAIINFTGFETGGTSELLSSTGTLSIQTTTKRTGAYALRINPTAGIANVTINGVGATGKAAEIGRTGETFISWYMRFASLPTGTLGTVRFRDSSSQEIVRVNVGTGGAVTLVGTSTSSTIATLSTGTWHRFDMRVTSNGTCGLAVDGGSETTVTGNNFTFDRITIGSTSSNTMEMFIDDLVISDTAKVLEPAVFVSVPISGTATVDDANSWGPLSGTLANAYQMVDEIPHNGATDYLLSQSSTRDQYRLFPMQGKATVGFTTPIASIKAIAIIAESGSTTTSGAVQVLSNATHTNSTLVDIGNTSYVPIQLILDTDPDTSAAWTDGAFDVVQVGPKQQSDTSTLRCTAVYAMVLTRAAATAADLTLSTSDGVATATLALRSPALLTLSTAAGVAAPTMDLISPALLSLASDGVATASLDVISPALLTMAADGLSSATASLSAAALLTLSQVDGVATAAATVMAPSLVILSTSDGIATAALEVITLAAGEMSLDSTIGTSNATLAVSTTGFLVPGAVAGLSNATLAVQAPAQLVLSTSAGLSDLTLGLQSPALLSLLTDGTSSAAATISTIAYLVPATIDGVATAALVVISPALLTMQADGVASASGEVTAPANVIVSTIDGLSNATLAVKSPALLQLSADGLSTAALAVKSPALLSLSASGLASSTVLVSSPALLALLAEGLSLATISEISLGPTTKVRLGGGIMLRPILINGGTQRVVIIGAGYTNPVRLPGGF